LRSQRSRRRARGGSWRAHAGSLVFSEVSQFIPCRLCWFQRIGMYPLAVLLLIAALRRDVRGGALYGLPLAIFGAVVAIYHIYIEYHPEAETAGCKIGAPCSTKWIDKIGYITIPVLALTAFLAIITLLVAALTRSRAR
jgi:disulfide bond formation protein DsbB